MSAGAAWILGGWVTFDLLAVLLLILLAARAGVLTVRVSRPTKPRKPPEVKTP